MQPEIELAKKMDALGLWDELGSGNFAIRPRGTAFPYFCTVFKDENPIIKTRYLMLEGWQTLHDFLRTRVDNSFGFYSSPSEMPHFELIVLKTGDCRVYRNDPGYMPRIISEKERPLVKKLLWESYGIMMRLEGGNEILMSFADEAAIFSRVEDKNGKWSDAPLAIIQPRPHVESISFPKDILKKAGDLPFEKDFAISVDFRFNPLLMTGDRPPKCVYELVGAEPKNGKRLFASQTFIGPEFGLKEMWEAMPSMVLRHLIQLGKVPGAIRTRSQRVFRMLRPLAVELPFRLSFHEQLPELVGFELPNQGMQK